MKLGSVYMYIIQRLNNNPRNGDTEIPCPRPKNFKIQKSSSKVLASVFWDKDGIFLVDSLKEGATITAKNCLHFSTN
jgi:hypothetical protein